MNKNWRQNFKETRLFQCLDNVRSEIQGDHYVLVRQTEAIWWPKCNLTKKLFFSKILKRFMSLNKYKTVFLYHQILNSKQPWASKTVKFIGHTSI